MDKKTDKSTMIGVALYETERAIIQSENERLGLRNFSATLRMIIREWRELTATPPGNDKNKGERNDIHN